MTLRKNTGGAYGALRDPRDSTGLRRDMVVVKEYIKAHCREKLTCEKIAREMGLSESYLEKLFGREVGATITEYIRICRMEESKVLLKTTSMRIKDIGHAVGIESPSWYSNCFHRLYGISPSAYRKKMEE
ncbi:MAG: helix-turn-helix transcriptional regulator [Lachnospiraceae bacterium]|nr:helix-turn-helix transcriptional regulator [Lachnospiraceae bacterium]